jgi:hemolysin activation/secretion protein
MRSSLQFADRPLLGLEQFGLGGQGSVRGYRQDVRLADNGLLASAEIQLPVLGESTQQGLLSVIPFFDVGTVWNNGNRTIRNPTTLASLGLGLQWQQSDNFRVRVDYGLPLVNLDSRRNTWQDNGVYFTVEYSFF